MLKVNRVHRLRAQQLPNERLAFGGSLLQTETNSSGGDGVKKAEVTNGTRTTLIWDGTTLIGEI